MNSKRQLKLILLYLFNKTYAIVPFFIRRTMLRSTGCSVGKGTHIYAGRFFSFGKLNVGDHATVNAGCYLDNRRGIVIGNNVVIAHDCKLYTLGHDVDDPDFALRGAPVVVEDYSVVFSNALIMPGVTIRRGGVVLPGSVVTKDVPPYTVVGGNPAKHVRERHRTLDYHPAYGLWCAY